jgi:septal ring factor EnvC (AmiA/AmiB activator)
MAETDVATQAAADQTAQTQAAGATTTTTDSPDLDALKKELAEARKEAAKYRTSLRSQEQAQQEAEAARLKEAGEFKALYEKEQAARAQLEAQVAQAQRAQQQLDAAIAAGLPPSMAPRLMGDTPEALAADAKALAELVKPPVPATGATNPAAVRGAQQAGAFDPKNPPRLSDITWKK